MKIFRKSILVIIILLAGCGTAKVVMKIDPSLDANAMVYEVTYPDSLRDKLSGKDLNVSFGNYRVTDADVGWQRTKKISETEDTNITIFGFSNIDDTSDTTHKIITSQVYQSINYKFKVGTETTWDSQCDHVAMKRVTQKGSLSRLELLSSNFTCKFMGADNELWVLSVDSDGSPQQDIKFTNKEMIFSAYTTAGAYVKSDGSTMKYKTHTAGYTWTKDNNNIAAISVREEIPRVWLDKGNSDSTNDVLAMASSGLLVYYWKIVPTLSQQ